MIAAALSEYCRETDAKALNPPVECLQLFIDTNLRVGMLLEPMMGRVDPACCALHAAADWLKRRYGTEGPAVKQMQDQKNCTNVSEIQCVGPRRFKAPMAELRRAIWLVMTGASPRDCLLYTSDAADEEDSVDLGGRRIIKKKKKKSKVKRKEKSNTNNNIIKSYRVIKHIDN
eukprot:TRINITY_DN51556_c0_g1_i1.p1 TRINITY_DN51556_c0_g1~~TRINITY_DN51556_c0_g1_i1.p1  ORF type:complete len:173 (+),score=20.39 TRINITY_DN51556_c0_g1_i1:155-673(+)